MSKRKQKEYIAYQSMNVVKTDMESWSLYVVITCFSWDINANSERQGKSVTYYRKQNEFVSIFKTEELYLLSRCILQRKTINELVL